MRGRDKLLRVNVLGGTSKLWQAVAPYWYPLTSPCIETCVWARRGSAGVDLVSPRGQAANVLPSCDVVLALWGVTSGSELALAENVELALEAQEIALALGAYLVVHAMTGAVYAPSSTPLTETAETRPRHAYGWSKLAAERAAATTRPKSVCLRLGNVAGADGLAAALRNGQPMVLDRFADGTCPHRSYIAPDDLAGVLKHVVLNSPDIGLSIMNVAGPRPVAMDALLDAAGVRFSLRSAPAEALPVQYLDVNRLLSLGAQVNKSADPRHLARFLTGTKAAA